jgi:peptidyl-prolyl cis-trans isomerase D
VDGKFSPDAYHAALRSINMSPERFESEQREYVLARQLDRGLYSSAFVLPAELERRVALLGEMRTIGWVAVPAREFEAAVVLDDAAIAAYYEANRSRYMSEEQATVDFVELDIDAYAAKADVSEAALASSTRRTRRATSRRAAATRATSCSPRAVTMPRRGEAKRAYERATAGEDFAALARELSEDPARRTWAATSARRARGLRRTLRRRRVEHAAGRDPRAGEDGVRLARHQARVRVPEITRSFDDVRAELEPEYRRSQVDKSFGDAQERLDTLAFEAGNDLGSVATKMGLPLKRIESYTRAGERRARRDSEADAGGVFA